MLPANRRVRPSLAASLAAQRQAARRRAPLLRVRAQGPDTGECASLASVVAGLKWWHAHRIVHCLHQVSPRTAPALLSGKRQSSIPASHAPPESKPSPPPAAPPAPGSGQGAPAAAEEDDGYFRFLGLTLSKEDLWTITIALAVSYAIRGCAGGAPLDPRLCRGRGRGLRMAAAAAPHRLQQWGGQLRLGPRGANAAAGVGESGVAGFPQAAPSPKLRAHLRARRCPAPRAAGPFPH